MSLIKAINIEAEKLIEMKQFLSDLRALLASLSQVGKVKLEKDYISLTIDSKISLDQLRNKLEEYHIAERLILGLRLYGKEVKIGYRVYYNYFNFFLRKVLISESPDQVGVIARDLLEIMELLHQEDQLYKDLREYFD